ncbi:MAG TPA: dihydromonapterin reductase [Pseudomonas xinjiangensis]|uniref:Dihydromonapterin reductase n=2 Tax=root TaxID=1 RepID=A0A7V1BN28_9GAMM|nr:dihydromonapterin reductase [Halopseudomonas xinjiangensis]HEC49185.1 dihydromonapterin reductase [Halopseudomonas xinjiangensis]
MDSKPTVLITGAAQRVGLHCAQRFVDDGFAVIITCRHLRAEWASRPLVGIDVIVADFSTWDGIQGLIDTLRQKRVRLRALVHNASLWLDDKDQQDAFQQMFMVHMQAPYLLNNAFNELRDPGLPADIIHISDHVARRGSARHIAYCSSKAGLEALSLSYAARLAPGVKVNTIAPALVMFNTDDSPEYRAKALSKSALGIEPGPEVVYQSIRYLMDTPYVTGTCLELNGGRDLK